MAGLILGGVIGHITTRSFSAAAEKKAPGQPASVTSPTETAAATVVIPLIDLEDTTIEEVIDFLRVRVPDLERKGVTSSPKYLNFLIFDSDSTAKEMTMVLRDIRLDHLCERLAQASGLSVSFDDDAIVFAASSHPGEDQRSGVEPPSI